MTLIQVSDYSPINTPSSGVIPQPYANYLAGDTAKYESKGGKRMSKKQQRRSKKAKKNKRSRKTRSSR